MGVSCLNAQPPKNRDLDEDTASISHILFSDAEDDLPTSDSEDDDDDDNE